MILLKKWQLLQALVAMSIWVLGGTGWMLAPEVVLAEPHNSTRHAQGSFRLIPPALLQGEVAPSGSTPKRSHEHTHDTDDLEGNDLASLTDHDAPYFEQQLLTEDKEEHQLHLIEELTYLQHPGLPPAASKIFFSKNPWTISGASEIAYTHYLGDKNRSSGDIELYNTNLYRLILYGAYRPVDWLVLYAEAFVEAYHDGVREVEYEVLPEVFVDLLLTNPGAEAQKRGQHIGPLNLRVGWMQVPIGYVNNNDEPIQFYSVNRPEVERLIVPTQWIELGAQLYGKLGLRAEWLVMAFQGVSGQDLVGGTWIRQGRNPGLSFQSPAVAAQVNTELIDDLELSLSIVVMESGSRADVMMDGELQQVRSNTMLTSGYVRYDPDNWTFMALATYGSMAQTDLMYELTRAGPQGPQVLGSQTFGYYFEVGCDILPYFRRSSNAPVTRSWLYRSDELKLPLFVRYERLDTHAGIDAALMTRMDPDSPIIRSNLDILTFGLNFNLRRNLVIKANYQFRHNRSAAQAGLQEADRIETGLGLIF